MSPFSYGFLILCVLRSTQTWMTELKSSATLKQDHDNVSEVAPDSKLQLVLTTEKTFSSSLEHNKIKSPLHGVPSILNLGGSNSVVPNNTFVTSTFIALITQFSNNKNFDLEQPVKGRLLAGHRKNSTNGVLHLLRTPFLGLSGKSLDMIEFENFVRIRRERNQLAYWAYYCMVTLLVLTLWAMWYLGGFKRCRCPTDMHLDIVEERSWLSVWGEKQFHFYIALERYWIEKKVTFPCSKIQFGRMC